MLFANLPAPDAAAVEAAKARDAQLTKPAGALGRLERSSNGSLRGRAGRRMRRLPSSARSSVFAGNHGVVAQGVSAYPAGVTAQMVANFMSGGAAINQICNAHQIGLKVFELALERPTKDFTTEPAMDEREAAATFAYGMEAPAGADIFAVGEMGIGNTTSAAAIYTALYGGPGSALDGTRHGRRTMKASRARTPRSTRRSLCMARIFPIPWKSCGA